MEKAGATVLFEDPATRGNTIGVVVNPVRLSTLKDFGSPDDVAQKLIAAERRKVRATVHYCGIRRGNESMLMFAPPQKDICSR